MEIKYKNDIEDLVEVVVYEFNHSKSPKSYYQSIRFISSILFFLAAILLFHFNTLLMTIMIFLSIIWFCVSPKIFFSYLRKSFRKLAKREYSKFVDIEQTLILDESGILRSLIDAETKFYWSGLNKVDITDNLVIIYFNSKNFIVIPKRYFNGTKELDTFLNYINSNVTQN